MGLLKLSGREEELVELLGELISMFGYQRLVRGPLVGTSDVVGSARASGAGTRQVLRRMLDCVGLADVKVKLEDRRDLAAAPAKGPTQPAINFVGLRGQVAAFTVDELGQLEDIVGVLAHQVGRVFLAGAKHPFRDSARVIEQSEERASAAAVYLGFAAPATNVTHQVRSSSEYSLAAGAMSTTTLVIRAGALPAEDMAFLVALRVAVSEASSKEKKRVAGQLHGQLGDLYRQDLAELGPHDRALRERLRIPPPAEWPSAESLALPRWRAEPLEDDDDSKRAAQRRERNRGEPVFRVASDKKLGYGLGGGAAGVIAAGAIVSVGLAPVIGLGVAAIFTIGGHRIGKAKRYGTCSDPSCKQVLSAGSGICPGCGGTISGSIAHIDERLAAEEAHEPD